MPKRTYQPKKKQGRRKKGFLSRMKNRGGRKMIKRRRQKSRKRLTL